MPKHATSIFGAQLRMFRKRARLTQRELGTATGYSEAQICRFEHDHQPPDASSLLALFAPTLHIADEVELAQWLDAAALLRASPRPGPAAAPNKGRPLPPGQAHSMSTSLTRLIGRASELNQLTEMFLAKSQRLVTVVGPPGVGKTRLAFEAAARLAPHMRDGVCLVNLTSIGEAHQVLPTIATAMQVKQIAGRELLDVLCDFIKHKSMLLVLDNFEHVSAAAAQVHALLKAAPDSAMLVTSRIPLGVAGETEFALFPLEVPQARVEATITALGMIPAVELFVERATAVRHTFALTADNAADIARICVELDGLPLAIELAAARCRVFTPAGLLQKLLENGAVGRLAVLVSSNQNPASRHGSMREALAWSVDLLSDVVRTCFLRLGALPADLPLDLVVRICDGDARVIDILASHSLIQVDHAGADSRVSMLKSLREFAGEIARDTSINATVNRSLVDWCIAWCEPFSDRTFGALEVTAGLLARFTRERHLIEHALIWCLHNPAAPAMCMAALAGIGFHFIAQPVVGRNWLRAFRDHADPDLASRASLLARLGLLEERCSNWQASGELILAARALYLQLGDVREAACCSVRLADVYLLNLLRFDEAIDQCNEAETVLVTAIESDATLSWVYSVLSRAHAGREERALCLHFSALSARHAAQTKDLHARAWMTLVAADVALCYDDFFAARQGLLAGLLTAKSSGNIAAQVYALLRMVSVEQETRDVASAHAHARDALGLAREVQVPSYVGQLAVLVVSCLSHARPALPGLRVFAAAHHVTSLPIERLPPVDARHARHWLADARRTLGDTVVDQAMAGPSTLSESDIVDACLQLLNRRAELHKQSMAITSAMPARPLRDDVAAISFTQSGAAHRDLRKTPDRSRRSY